MVFAAVVGRDLVRRPQLVHAGRDRLRDRDRAGRRARGPATCQRHGRPRRRPTKRPATATPDRRRPDSNGAGASRWPLSAARRFVVAIALLYGSTMALEPAGWRPARSRTPTSRSTPSSAKGLAATGTETNIFTSGFSDLPGVPAQTWYHWGELWLASAIITIFGIAPLAARYLVVLPLLLLAAAALTGTLVRRINGTRLAAGLPLRVRRLPVPGADPVDPRPVLQRLGRRPDLRDRRVRARRGGGPVRPVPAGRDGSARDRRGRSPALPAAPSRSSCRRMS